MGLGWVPGSGPVRPSEKARPESVSMMFGVLGGGSYGKHSRDLLQALGGGRPALQMVFTRQSVPCRYPEFWQTCQRKLHGSFLPGSAVSLVACRISVNCRVNWHMRRRRIA